MTRLPKPTPRAVLLMASVSLVGAGVIGCADTPAAQSGAVPTAPAASRNVRVGLDDAAHRLAPSLDRLLESSALQDALKAANTAIERGDARALKVALDRADRAVTRLADGKHEGASADLDALRLSLGEARELLSSMSNPSPSPDVP